MADMQEVLERQERETRERMHRRAASRRAQREIDEQVAIVVVMLDEENQSRHASREGRGPNVDRHRHSRDMSAYDNVVGGKLKLKGKALDVKAGGVKKKKKPKHQYNQGSTNGGDELPAGGSSALATDPVGDMVEADNLGEGHPPAHHDLLTPAEKRYIEQRDKINVHRLAKIANKSHRDRIQDFNQYLANLSEHYDIPKVGPG